MVSLAAFLVLLSQSPDSSAYLDRDARVLVARARAARDSQATTILAYTALVKQRAGAALRTPLKDRTLYRKELAARVHWSREEESVVQILGAKEFLVGGEYGNRPPSHFSLDEMFDPSLDRLYFGITDSEDEGVWIDHPLVEGAEAKYRFQTGDTITMRFAGGDQLRVVELRVVPRSKVARLISGSIWIEPNSGVIVKAAYHMPATINMERDTDIFEDDDDLEHVPELFKPFELDITMISVEYSYWRLKHWLPRSLRMEGMARAGILKLPGALEVSYDFQEVVEEGDSIMSAPEIRDWRLTGYDVNRGRTNGRRVSTWSPRDLEQLASSPDLPPPIWVSSDDFITEKELRKMYGGLASLPQTSSPGTAVNVLWGPQRLDLLRFNRVEGPSIGATVEAQRTYASYWSIARLGLADLHPNLELGAKRETLRRTLTASVSHGLVAVDTRSLGAGASLSALLLGRDDGDYYRTTAARISVSPPVTRAEWYRASLFAERQRNAERETQMSLPRVFSSGFSFRPNLQADAADLAGLELQLRAWRGTDPRGFQGGIELNLDAAAGNFDYGRASLTARTAFPIVQRLRGALEAGGGSSEGQLPAQKQYFLGGAHTLRGYGGGAAVGPSFLRGRAELAYTTATVGVALFGDAGWAGRHSFQIDDSLFSTGVGATILDGLIRIDLARALRRSPGWRLELHLDATL